MTILDEIIARKRDDLARWRVQTTLDALRDAAVRRAPPPPFVAALRSRPIGLIAEVKRRSPSVGVIRTPFDPAAIARTYERGGAQAVSVLVDQPFFGGGEDDFRAVRAAVALPMLYKEFVVDAWQVWHAAALGASAVLLIVGALPPAELRALMAEIRTAGLQPLVEVHDEAELAVAAEAGADCIGINNRNLKTFRTALETTYRLVVQAPKGATLVSESGIKSADDVRRLREAGAHAVLVGEHLLRQPDLAAAVAALMSGGE